MTPERHPSGLPEDPKVLRPGLEYARSMMDLAILICDSFDSERQNAAQDPKPEKREN